MRECNVSTYSLSEHLAIRRRPTAPNGWRTPDIQSECFTEQRVRPKRVLVDLFTQRFSWSRAVPILLLPWFGASRTRRAIRRPSDREGGSAPNRGEQFSSN